jgi:hypothetical protein
MPKFAFGYKNNNKTKNEDFPGPGEYETDVRPTSFKNVAHVIGSEIRKHLSE